MPDQQVNEGPGGEVLPSGRDAPETGGRLLSVALFVFFIALLVLVAAMTLLPILLR